MEHSGQTQQRISDRIRQHSTKSMPGGTAGAARQPRLTQEQLLNEARETELANRASLEQYLILEATKKKLKSRRTAITGPHISLRSFRSLNGERTTVTFVDVPDIRRIFAPDSPTGAATKLVESGESLQ